VGLKIIIIIIIIIKVNQLRLFLEIQQKLLPPELHFLTPICTK